MGECHQKQRALAHRCKYSVNMMEKGLLSEECLWKVAGALMTGCHGDCFNRGTETFLSRSPLPAAKDSNLSQRHFVPGEGEKWNPFFLFLWIQQRSCKKLNTRKRPSEHRNCVLAFFKSGECIFESKEFLTWISTAQLHLEFIQPSFSITEPKACSTWFFWTFCPRFIKTKG